MQVFSTNCRVSEAMLAGFLGEFVSLCPFVISLQTARLCSLELVLPKKIWWCWYVLLVGHISEQDVHAE
jgi:hypothetical protein